jgi:glycine cleavage system transcriptional repressor
MARAVISAIGNDRPGIVNALAELVRKLELNIDDSRMTVLGGEFAILMSVTGSDAAVASLEAGLPALCGRLGLSHLFRRTRERDRSAQALPYRVRVRAMDHPGIVHEIAGFFSGRQINIEDLTTDTQPAAHTGTPIFSLTMRVEIPASAQPRALRAAFEEFCAERDLDGTLESA